MSFDFSGAIQDIIREDRRIKNAVVDARDELYRSLDLYASQSGGGNVATAFDDTGRRIIVSRGSKVILIEPIIEDGKIQYRIANSTLAAQAEEEVKGTFGRHDAEQAICAFLMGR